jgi:hypothetical protein
VDSRPNTQLTHVSSMDTWEPCESSGLGTGSRVVTNQFTPGRRGTTRTEGVMVRAQDSIIHERKSSRFLGSCGNVVRRPLRPPSFWPCSFCS